MILLVTGLLCLVVLARPYWGLLAVAALFPAMTLVPRGDVAGVNAETAVLGLATLVTAVRGQRFLPPPAILMPIAAWYAVMLLSLAVLFAWYDPAVHATTHFEILRLFKRALWSSLGFFLAFAWIRTPQQRDAVLTALVVGCVIAGLSGLLELSRPDDQTAIALGISRAAGVTDNPNILGILVAAFSVVCLDRALSTRRATPSRGLHAALYLLLLAALITSLSRKAWVGAAISHSLWLLYRHRRLFIPVVGTALVSLVLGYSLLPEVVRERVEYTFQPGRSIYRTEVATELDASSTTRVVLHMIGFEMFLDSPLWGYGFDGFRRKSVEYGAKYGLLQLRDPHSLPLRALVDGGLIGAASLAWLVWTVLWVGLRSKREDPDDPSGRLFLCACGALAFANVLGTVMVVPVIGLYFWICFGMLSRKVADRLRVRPAARPGLVGVPRWSPGR